MKQMCVVFSAYRNDIVRKRAKIRTYAKQIYRYAYLQHALSEPMNRRLFMNPSFSSSDKLHLLELNTLFLLSMA